MRKQRGGHWRLGLYWSWYDDWVLAIVRVPHIGLSTLVIGPFRVVVMRPVYRVIEAPEQRCIALPASIPA